MIYVFFYNSAQAKLFVTFNSIVKYNHLLWRSRRKCAATKMVSALSLVCVCCVLFCVCVVLLVQNINYSLTTFAFVLLFYSYSGQIAPINVITLNYFCIKNA